MTRPGPTAVRNACTVDGLIVVDHGSRRRESNDSLELLVAAYRADAPCTIVEAAHMELASPSIGEAFDRCVLQGATRIICFPFFLSPGRHWYQDIPDLVAEAAGRHPGVTWLVTAPLGRHPLLHTIINDRIEQCLACAGGTGSPCPECEGTDRCRFRAGEPDAT